MLALSDLIVMNLIVRARQVHPWHYHRFGLRRFVCHLKSIYKQHLGIIRSGEEGGVTYYSCIKHRKFMAKILKLTIGIALRRITVKHPHPPTPQLIANDKLRRWVGFDQVLWRRRARVARAAVAIAAKAQVDGSGTGAAFTVIKPPVMVGDGPVPVVVLSVYSLLPSVI